MLVINRRKDERVQLKFGDHTIIIQILNISSNKVAIGIDAPKEVDIARLQQNGSTRR